MVYDDGDIAKFNVGGLVHQHKLLGQHAPCPIGLKRHLVHGIPDI